MTLPLQEAQEEPQSTYATISKMLMIWVQIFYILKKKKMKHSDCKMGRKCVSAHGRKCPCASAHGLILRPWLVFFCPHTQLIC